MTRAERCIIPEDVKEECIAILAGYDRRLRSDKPEDRRRVEAVRIAAEKIGAEYPEKLRGKLIDGIFRNCENGRKYPFEKLGLSFMSRSDFYRHRLYFLYEMAVFLQID